MSKKSYGDSLKVQDHQLSSAQQKMKELDDGIEDLESKKENNIKLAEDIENKIDTIAEESGVNIEDASEPSDREIDELLELDEQTIKKSERSISLIDKVDIEDNISWNQFLRSIHEYANDNGIDISGDPFRDLMSHEQIAKINKRIDEDFTYQKPDCDGYDYAIASTSGLIGGIIDSIFVGVPGEGKLSDFSDGFMDKSVENFAKIMGWSGPSEGADSTRSAIGFLEQKFPVNYDHPHGEAAGGQVKMNTKNHHIKNLAHSPDLVGLVFSIIDQFNNTATFVDNESLITIDTDSFELQGRNFISMVFSGFANWFGHLVSDAAGSSGSVSQRGSGIPAPFYSLLQFVNIGEFGKHKQHFSKIAVQVFERGYDLRHGISLATPVLITELITNLSWTIKQRFYHGKEWGKCIPEGSVPELRRMLLVSHGVLCIVDAGDAAIRSKGGNAVEMMVRLNFFAQVRFSFAALKEVSAWYCEGKIDEEAVNEKLDQEYKSLLANS